MYGLDLFSGIGGITVALQKWVSPVAYCENDQYAQAVLLSRMSAYELPTAPIWDDVRTLNGSMLPPIDIVYGGFPCQDISVAGRGAGLGGERSGLFFEIVRLVGEIKPAFVFLENVPNIRTKGLGRVIKEMERLGYDCRWCLLSAADVGANHKRERWFLLAHSDNKGLEGRNGGELQERTGQQSVGEGGTLADTPCKLPYGDRIEGDGGTKSTNSGPDVADAQSEQSRRIRIAGIHEDTSATGDGRGQTAWWAVEPNVGRVANGIPKRVDRLRALGNAVVPAQAREAFERLMGLK